MHKKTKGYSFNLTLVLVAMLMILALTLTGCGKNDVTAPQNGNQNPNPTPAPTKQKVTLYFGDDQATYLEPEERMITRGDEPLEQAVVRELIKGPQKQGLVKTVPAETKIISLTVADGVAKVNFSQEFQTKHWGGSAGETMTLYSVVNSLGELPGIDQVQFLLEGEPKESILNGNMDTSAPLEPDYSLVDN